MIVFNCASRELQSTHHWQISEVGPKAPNLY